LDTLSAISIQNTPSGSPVNKSYGINLFVDRGKDKSIEGFGPLMDELSAIKFVENRSRFFAHLYHIENIGDIDLVLKEHRKRYKKANHHCWAMRFTDSDGKMVEYSKDDGEVGHPGKALLELMKNRDLTSHVMMVSRIFGGVKLGVGGVTRAFRSAGETALDQIR
jgi:putative IMPACT (imprinted ancient) family translation regulator